MTWPSDADKTELDEAGDDPKQARTELATLVDKFNTLKGHFSSLAQTVVSRATAALMRGDIDAQQTINSLTSETSPATGDLIGLRDVSAGADRKMTLADALKVINSLTAETAPATGDKLALYNASGGAADSITLADLLKVINALTADGSPDTAADYVVTYDASASAPKKVLLDDLGGGATAILKTADEVLNNNNTLQDDNHLVFTMEANKTYGFRLMLILTSGDNDGDFKIGWTVPTGATMFWGLHGNEGDNTEHWNSAGGALSSGNALRTESSTLILGASATETLGLIVEGIVRNGANAGDFQFQWAQNTSDTQHCTVKEGSNMVVRELGAT